MPENGHWTEVVRLHAYTYVLYTCIVLHWLASCTCTKLVDYLIALLLNLINNMYKKVSIYRF